MSRAATIFLLVAAVALAVFAVIYVPLSRDTGKAVGDPLFSFDPGQMRVIKITNGEKGFELKKSDDGWMIGPDPEDRASVQAVKRLIDVARQTPVLDRMARAEFSDRDQLSEYGLRKSSVQFDFKGDKDHPLLIGKDAADDTRVYVRFEDSRDVYLIPDDLVRMILQPAENYRDRMPVRLRPDRVVRVVIRRPAGEIELRKEGGGWQLIKPLRAAASETAVEGFLDKLFRTQIAGFEPDGDPASLGLAEPVAEVLAYGEGEDRPEAIRVGSVAPDGNYYVGLKPRDVTARLPASVMDLLSVDPTSFRDPAIARINMDLVDQIRVSTPEGKLVFKRDGEEWTLDGRKASSAAIQRLVEALALAKATRYKPATDAELKKTGLETPVRTVGFYSVISENTPEVAAGEHLIEEFRISQVAGELAVFPEGGAEVAFTRAPLLEAMPADPATWASP